jgi:L-aspartate oxidase
MLLSRRIALNSSRRLLSSTNNSTSLRSFSTADNTDRLLVIGSGVAGSAAALVAAELYQIPTTLVFAGALPTDCNSYWAQGGIIYKGLPEEDSPALLAQDIHNAGAGLCFDPAVQKVSLEGAGRVQQLLLDASKRKIFANVPFQRNAGTDDLSLTLGKFQIRGRAVICYWILTG